MKTYQILIGNFAYTAPRPDVLPVEGQVLTVLRPFLTLGDNHYVRGSELRLLSRTDSMPHSRGSSLGNWVVECEHTTSVWSNIEWMIADGMVA